MQATSCYNALKQLMNVITLTHIAPVSMNITKQCN